MDGKTGWIKISRKILDNTLWTSEEPFDRRSAWTDLILMANYEDKQFMSRRGIVIEVPAGSLFTSMRKLARRWRWSEKKVRMYLGELKGMKMVEIRGERLGTMISLVKYRDFQGLGRTDGRKEGRKDGRIEDTRLKNNKNIKKERRRLSSAEKIREMRRFAVDAKEEGNDA